jgi:zinc protease
MANRLARLTLFAVGALLATAAHAILPIQHWETSRGARVYFVENRDLPMFDLSVEFPAGAGFDTLEKAGVANLTNHMMRLGAGGLDEDEIARRIADVGARLGGRFDTDRAGLGLRTLSSKAERAQALDIFARILAQPAFPDAVIEREKVRLVSALKEANTKPDTIAAVTFSRLVYPMHPYGLRSSGEVETVASITREDVAAFHRNHYTVRHAVIAMMGDLTRDEAAEIAEAVTAQVPSGSAEQRTLTPVAQLTAGTSRWIRHHATQSHILMGAPGMRRADPDYFPLFVGNHILGGGGFVSRIVEEVRQKRGLAYSAYSYFSPMSLEGPFVIGMQTEGAQAAEALDVVRKTLAEFIAKGPTPAELEAAKKNIIGGFPLRIDSNRKIHEYLGMIGFYRLPLTYLDDFVKNVEKVSMEDIRRAFERRVHPDRMVTVVVGPVEEKQASSQAPR